MIAEWASIYIIYDASITLFEKAWTWHEVPVPNHLMETESEFAPWDLSKAHILVSTPAPLSSSQQHCGCQIYNSETSGTQTPKTLDLPLVNFELHLSSLYPQAWSWHSNQVDSWRVMKSPPTQALRLGILSQTHKTITIHQCSCYTPTLGLAKFGL